MLNVIHLQHVLFSVECVITVNCIIHINCQNCRYWPRDERTTSVNPWIVNVWTRIIGDHYICPCFSDVMLNGDNYLTIIELSAIFDKLIFWSSNPTSLREYEIISRKCSTTSLPNQCSVLLRPNIFKSVDTDKRIDRMVRIVIGLCIKQLNP